MSFIGQLRTIGSQGFHGVFSDDPVILSLDGDANGWSMVVQGGPDTKPLTVEGIGADRSTLAVRRVSSRSGAVYIENTGHTRSDPFGRMLPGSHRLYSEDGAVSGEVIVLQHEPLSREAYAELVGVPSADRVGEGIVSVTDTRGLVTRSWLRDDRGDIVLHEKTLRWGWIAYRLLAVLALLGAGYLGWRLFRGSHT